MILLEEGSPGGGPAAHGSRSAAIGGEEAFVGLRRKGLWMSGGLSTVGFKRFRDARTDAH